MTSCSEGGVGGAGGKGSSSSFPSPGGMTTATGNITGTSLDCCSSGRGGGGDEGGGGTPKQGTSGNFGSSFSSFSTKVSTSVSCNRGMGSGFSKVCVTVDADCNSNFWGNSSGSSADVRKKGSTEGGNDCCVVSTVVCVNCSSGLPETNCCVVCTIV